jgi:hypothetical protein
MHNQHLRRWSLLLLALIIAGLPPFGMPTALAQTSTEFVVTARSIGWMSTWRTTYAMPNLALP